MSFISYNGVASASIARYEQTGNIFELEAHMAVVGELLFFRRNGVDLDAVLRHQGDAGVSQVVEGLSEREIRETADDVLVQAVVVKTQIAPLVVNWEEGKAGVTEIMLDTVNMFQERIRVKGLRATKTFSFSGDPDLWYLRTNPYDMNPPRGEIGGRRLTVGMEVRDHEGDQAAAHIESSVRVIKEWLQRQEAQIATYNATVPARALSLIVQRRTRLGNASDLLKKLQG